MSQNARAFQPLPSPERSRRALRCLPRCATRVEKAARALGYSPNVLARSLTTRRTKLIGLVSNNFQNPIFLEVFDRFTRGLQDKGYRPLLLNLSDETNPEKSVDMMRQYSVDGVILASSTLPPIFAQAFRAAGIPVVHSFGPNRGCTTGPCGRDRQYRMRSHGCPRTGRAGLQEARISGRTPDSHLHQRSTRWLHERTRRAFGGHGLRKFRQHLFLPGGV